MPYSNDPLRYRISTKLKFGGRAFKKVQSFKSIFLLLIAISIFFYFASNLKPLSKISNSYDKILNYVYNYSNKLTHNVQEKRNNIISYIQLKKKYNELREEYEAINAEVVSYSNIADENKELRKLMKFHVPQGKLIKSTTISMQSFDGYVKIGKLPIGSIHGIKAGHIVINDKGLVGQVIETRDNSSKILLVTSSNSQIPVIFSNSRVKAILSGGHKENLILTLLHGENLPQIGDLALTSGDDGYFPPAIIVGKVSKVSEDFVEIEAVFSTNNTHVVSIIENL